MNNNMLDQVARVVPDRDALRALYDAAIDEVNKTRPKVNLKAGFYAETGDAVFDAGLLALADYCDGSTSARRVHVVSAPAGGGKTSFSYAFMLAVTRYAEANPRAPYGCVFVVDQIKKADEVFAELNALLPGQVGVWSTEHDPKCKKRKAVTNPAATFTKQELRKYPIIVVTHAFYNGTNRHEALNARRGTQFPVERGLVMVDERPEEVQVYEVTMQQAIEIKDKVVAKRPDLADVLDALMLFMMPHSLSGNGNQIRPAADHYDAAFVQQQLEWFVSAEADHVARRLADDIPGIGHLFGLAKTMIQGCAFASQSNSVTHFVGWQSKLVVRPGIVLLDATADIDGITQLCPWRKHAVVPQGHYANLEIIHVPQHTRKRLNEYFKKVDNREAYVRWMVEVIKAHMAPGERGLVVCKKALFDNKNVPTGPHDDPDSYTKHYGWDIDERKLCAIHYGTGIGSNSWKEATVVFLFDEYYLSRRIAAANVQGLKGHKADEGELASMTTVNSKANGLVDIFADGHRQRWTKQMALRGSGRTYDEHGNCGKQRLVISSDLKSFMSQSPKLFPGATVRVLDDYREDNTWSERVLRVFSDADLPSTVTSPQLSMLLDRKWGTISKRVMTPQFMASLTALGWEYIPGRGKRASVFKKTLGRSPLMAA